MAIFKKQPVLAGVLIAIFLLAASGFAYTVATGGEKAAVDKNMVLGGSCCSLETAAVETAAVETVSAEEATIDVCGEGDCCATEGGVEVESVKVAAIE